jgi:hypothetical protein
METYIDSLTNIGEILQVMLRTIPREELSEKFESLKS